MFPPFVQRLVLGAIVVGLCVQTAMAQTAEVSVLKTASPEPVTSGGTLTYTLMVTNEGPDSAANVTLSDPLPPGVVFQSISSIAGWSCLTPAVGSNGTVTCSTTTFAVGGVDFTLVTTVSPSVSDGTVLSNVATVSTTTTDPKSNNDTSQADSTVAAPASPTLTITKSGAPDPVTAGTILTYTITVSDNGTVDLDAAAIRDTLPSATTFVSLTPPGGWSCSTPAVGSGGTVTCSAPGMTASSSAVFTLVVMVDPATPAGNVTNQAFFDTTVGGRDSTISTSVSTAVVVSADLSITKSDAPDPVATGSNITYTINVTNPGPSNASSVNLSDTIPASTSFVSLVPAAGWSCSGTSTITCSMASMPPTTSSFQLVVKTGLSAAGTTVSNTATVSSISDANTANNSATATTSVSLVPTTTTVSVSPTPAYLGQTVTFAANVTDGSFTPTGTVQFKVDGSPVGAPVTLAGGAATYSTNTLAPGSHTVSADYAGGGGFMPSSGSAPAFTVLSITITQIPLLGREGLMALALLLAAIAISAGSGARP